MKKKKIEIIFNQGTFEELNSEEKELVKKAQESLKNAYAVYSGFMVGSSVLLANGEIFNGNNQENVAYPSGLCAERVALFYASAQYPDISVRMIAISAKSKTFTIQGQVSPCGACRQVMAEYEVKQKLPIRIILHSAEANSVLIADSVADLLPFLFKSPLLKRH